MKTKKRMLSIILAAVMIISMLPIATHAVEPVFSDMPDNWSTAALKHAVENGLLQGSDGKLMPDDNLTRAQMATIIVRAFGATKKGNISHYTDIKATDWYADNMAIAYQMGIIQGSDNKMNPGNPITRQEAFVIIARALKLEPEHTFNKVFTDAHEIADWAEGEIKALVNNGYIQGSNGKLNPKGHITRAEFAQVLHNIIKQYINKEGEYSTVSDGNIMINTPGVTLKNATIKGDLIIGEGVGDGEVVLEDVEITGRMVVRGGGKDSIIIKGSSKISKVIVARTYGTASIKIQDKADISKIIIDESSKDVNIEGQTKKIEVKAPNIIVEAIKAEIDTIEIYGQGSVVILDKDTRVKTIAIKEGANKAEVDVEGKADTIITTAASTKITGSGEVSKVEVKEGADKSKIETPNTEITVDKGVTGVTGRGGTAISGGTTAVNVEKDIAVETPKEEDKGGGGGGGSSKSSVSAISVTPESITLLVGQEVKITATVEPSNATNKKVNWTSSNTDVATVDANGVVTAKAKGIVYITATSAADSTKSATCKVIVADDWSDVADTTWYKDTDSSFTISTAEQLAGLALLVNRDENPVNFSDKTITLGADIDLLGLEWVPIGYAKRDGYAPADGEPSFQGVFDGNRKTISNLKITPKDNIEDGSEEYAYGLIGCMTKGSVRDLTINNPQIDGTGYSNGAVVGFLSYGYSNDANSVINIENCTVVGGKIKGHEAAGGIIGRLIGSRDSADNDATPRIQVVNCENQGTAIEVTSNNAAGGIVGNQYRTHNTKQVLIKDCVNSGNVTSLHMAGGIAGQIATGTLDGGTNTGTIIGGYTDKGQYGHYNGGHLIGYSTGAEIKNVTDLFDLKNIFETGGGMPIYIELTGDITATGYKGEMSSGGTIEQDTITMKNCRFLDFSGNTTLTVAEGKTIYLYTGYNNTVRGERRGESDAALTIAGEGNVNVGKEGSLKHFYKDKAGTVVAADESGNVEKGKYNLFVKSEDNANRNQEIWVDATPPTLQSLTAYVGEETRVAKDNTLTWTVGETVTKIEAVASEPVRLVDGANAVVTMSEVGDNPRITDAEYGTIAVDKDDPTKIIITPNSGNETAGLAGEFTFTVAAGVIEDLASNKNAAVSITLNVQPDQAAINERLAITSVSIADNKAYASTAAGEGNTVRVLGYGVCINLDAKGDGKTVNDTTSIVVELYKEETLLGQQTFNDTGYSKHANASSISGTIDAGGQYVATSWNNSWSANAKISDIPDKAVAKVQYKDGIATVEKQLTFTDAETKIFFAAEAVYALFTNPLADVDELVLADGVTQEQINTASGLVDEVTVKPEQNKVVLLEMIAKANNLLNPEQGSGNNEETGEGTSEETGEENS